MQTTTAQQTLRTFRRQVYQALGQRKDSLFELMEAVLASQGRANIVHLSLAAPFRRCWSSAADALADGRLEVSRCQQLLREQAACLSATERPVWAGDGTVWPRPAARTVAERTYGHRVNPGIPQSGLVPGWEYEWLFVVPAAQGSWVLPLDVTRRGPTAGTSTQVAIEQLRAACAEGVLTAPRPVATYDSGYDPVRFARAGLPVTVLVRLRPNRRFFRDPPAYRGQGRRPKHGPVFKLFDPATHSPADRSAVLDDPVHGRVIIDAWRRLHVLTAADAPLTVVRVQVERLPRHGSKPAPLWLAWIGEALPDDLALVWRWYTRRFSAEHGFRFLKQELGWTTVQPGSTSAADRWSWLLALVCWQLWLARPLVSDRRLPWEASRAATELPPGRVRRAFGPLFLELGTPARVPKQRGNSPGRRPGDCPGPRERHPVVRRAAQRVA